MRVSGYKKVRLQSCYLHVLSEISLETGFVKVQLNSHHKLNPKKIITDVEFEPNGLVETVRPHLTFCMYDVF